MKRKGIPEIISDMRSELREVLLEQEEYREAYRERAGLGIGPDEAWKQALARGLLNGRKRTLAKYLPLLRPGYKIEWDTLKTCAADGCDKQFYPERRGRSQIYHSPSCKSTQNTRNRRRRGNENQD